MNNHFSVVNTGYHFKAPLSIRFAGSWKVGFVVAASQKELGALKLVLLPGLDGTGRLFSPLLRSLTEFECEVLALPEVGRQDYNSITRTILAQLPKDDFILVAESFSGPIGAALAEEGIERLKGIIFVATFLSAPRKALLGLTRWLPLKIFASLPFATSFHKLLFLGLEANNELTRLFESTVKGLSTPLIRARLNSIYSLVGSPDSCNIPVVYIQASLDKLVPASKASEFKSRFKNIIVKTIDGPHFILQAKPDECAKCISECVPLLTKHC